MYAAFVNTKYTIFLFYVPVPGKGTVAKGAENFLLTEKWNGNRLRSVQNPFDFKKDHYEKIL